MSLVSISKVQSRATSRKVVHIVVAPLYTFLWLLFEGDDDLLSTRAWAAAVPLLMTLRAFLTGIGILKDPAFVE